MRKVAMIISAGLMLGASAHADSVPRCWQADQPGVEIDDGLFRVFIPTANHDALSVARLLAILEHTAAGQDGVGTRPGLDRIEIDMFGELKYWQPSSVFPTLDTYKDYIVRSMEPVLTEPGVTIECSVQTPRQ